MSRSKKKKYSCDFETCTWEKGYTYVWAWAVCEIGNIDNIKYGSNIDTFFNYIFTLDNPTLYFHNLKFDGSFLISWLIRNNYEFVEDKENIGDMTFTTLISDRGQWYNITVYNKVLKKRQIKFTFNDSLKLLPFSVKEIAKSFRLDIKKGEIDYNYKRNENWIMTNEEKEYIKNDVQIVAIALDFLFNENMNRLTTGANALAYYKAIMNDKVFKRLFPILPYEQDYYIRQSYKGGYTYLNDKYKNKDIGEGIVFDVNSLYPSRMMCEELPVGYPIYFIGEYKTNVNYPLYIQQFSCIFEVKENHLPTIQVKNNRWKFDETEYLKSSDGETVTMTLTNVDLKLFLEHYDVIELEYIDGFMFRSCKGLFTQYIEHWSNEKIKAKKEKNYGMYILSKLMLNTLYGKFGTNPNVASKQPYLDDEGILKFHTTPFEQREPVYIPMATFITSYARNLTIRSAQKVYHRFMYADTDSLHLEGTEIPKELNVDDYELGAWKLESHFDKAKYIRQKCYIEREFKTISDLKSLMEEWNIKRRKKHLKRFKGKILTGFRKIKVTCAGMPKNIHKQVTFENFKEGSIYNGKLQPKQIKGGVILQETTFEIKKTCL